MVVLFLFCYQWFICVCAGRRISELLHLRVQTAAVGYEIWTCYLHVGLHSHQIRSCSETLQGCAVIVRQEGRRVIKRTGPTVWRGVVWFALLGWRQITERCDGQQCDSDCRERKLLSRNEGKRCAFVTESDLVWTLRWSCDFSTLMPFCGGIMLYLLFFFII